MEFQNKLFILDWLFGILAFCFPSSNKAIKLHLIVEPVLAFTGLNNDDEFFFLLFLEFSDHCIEFLYSILVPPVQVAELSI